MDSTTYHGHDVLMDALAARVERDLGAGVHTLDTTVSHAQTLMSRPGFGALDRHDSAAKLAGIMGIGRDTADLLVALLY